MTGNRHEQTSRLLWRRRWLILAMVLIASGSTAIFSKLQTPVYSATSTLVVNQPASDRSSFEVVQANQAYARTLAHLIGSRNVADRVAPRLSFAVTPASARDRMSFSPVNETQLIEVSAEHPVPQRAQELANVWASSFVDYVTTNLPQASPSSGLSVADAAVLPAGPSRPKPTLYTLVALLLSTAAAVAFVLVRSRLDTRIPDSDALSREFGLPVLGTLPIRTGTVRSRRRYEEAVRVLTTALQFASDRPLRSVAVTSSRESEGKSTVTAELARSFALLALVDQAVLAVDADLRRPSLHERLGLGEGSHRRRGLTTFLQGEEPVEACVQQTDLLSLRLLPSGPLPQSPATLLGFGSSRQAMGRLREAAEVVVIDTPPLAAGADAGIVATEVDGVILVVDLSKARRHNLREALDQLARVDATLLGFVVNRAPVGDRSAAAAYYYRTPSQPPLRREQQGALAQR